MRRVGLLVMCLGLTGYFVACSSKVKGAHSQIGIDTPKIKGGGTAPTTMTTKAGAQALGANARFVSMTFVFVEAKDADGMDCPPTTNMVLKNESKKLGGAIVRELVFPGEDLSRTTGKCKRPLKVTLTAESLITFVDDTGNPNQTEKLSTTSIIEVP